jgi:two-component system NtrC family sensor kinase
MVELTERTIDLDGAPATMVLARDVTERVGTQAKLMHSDRLATLGTLVAGIVHEINNPLGSVLANVQYARELAEKGPLERERAAEMLAALSDAEQGIGLVAGIARDLKSFGRDDDGVRTGVDLRRVVRAALTLTKANLHSSAELTVSLPEDVLLVVANESRLAQVFINLLLNATQAMDGAPRKDRRVGVTVMAEGLHAVVDVSDTGHGMTAETIERLFEPFFTTKAPGVGTGLGLWMCRNIVQAHGGTMTVQSAVGRGSVFRVWLPRAA